jgi:hypothetical protein
VYLLHQEEQLLNYLLMHDKSTHTGKSTESSSIVTEVPNTNPFYVKKMNIRIQVCQGCRGPLKSAGKEIHPPPFDYCIARRERRPYRDDNGQLKTPSRQSDLHYHLWAACVKTAEPSTYSLVIPTVVGC